MPDSLTRRLAVVTAVILVAAGAILGSSWLNLERSRDAFAKQGAGYAARVMERIGTLSKELRESSGVAVSRTQPGVLWSHNDSGDGPLLYAIDQSGQLLATVKVARAAARDWEDMSLGPCPETIGQFPAIAHESCLYIGDVGDNNGVRDAVTIHVVVEPILRGADADGMVVNARSLRFRYPEGPEDSEALAVLPNGDVTIVSKGRSGTISLYGLTASSVARALKSGEVLTASRQPDVAIASAPAVGRYVTGAAVSPDGTTLAVRTYTEVFFFRAVPGGSGPTRWRNLERPCFLGAVEPLGEAIGYLDADTMVLTSERGALESGPIHRLQC
jgi:hypothetical protein